MWYRRAEADRSPDRRRACAAGQGSDERPHRRSGCRRTPAAHGILSSGRKPPRASQQPAERRDDISHPRRRPIDAVRAPQAERVRTAHRVTALPCNITIDRPIRALPTFFVHARMREIKKVSEWVYRAVVNLLVR
jgi:hypothetical protein